MYASSVVRTRCRRCGSMAQGKTSTYGCRLTGNGQADIVGFKDEGVDVAFNNGDGTFQSKEKVIADFGYEAGYWGVWDHPRLLADLTGESGADIIGFGDDGVWVAVNFGGSF